MAALTEVTQLELPVFDYYEDATLRGERYHETMRELAERSWLADSPLAYFVLDREAAMFFLRTKKATFPGMKIAELFGVESGPLYEEMRRNILHVNGADHARLRQLVNPSLTPRAADRRRPAMRGFIEELYDAVADQGRCDFVAAFAKPYPSLTIANFMGAPLEDAPRLRGPPAGPPPPPARVVDLDPAPVRRAEPDDRARADRAGGGGVLRVLRGADRAAPQRPRRRPGL